MNRQYVFNTVARHLLTQRKQALRPSLPQPDGAAPAPACVYRSPRGLKCAIGALIPDEMYCPRMEGNSVRNLLMDHPELTSHLKLKQDLSEVVEIQFLDTLQQIHDDNPEYDWPLKLLEFAEQYGLDPQVVHTTNAERPTP